MQKVIFYGTIVAMNRRTRAVQPNVIRLVVQRRQGESDATLSSRARAEALAQFTSALPADEGWYGHDVTLGMIPDVVILEVAASLRGGE